MDSSTQQLIQNMSFIDKKRQRSDPNRMKEIIHSGHFMVSDIDDPEVQEEDDNPSLVVHESDCDQESLPLPEKGFDFESACKETSKTYTFGSRSTHSISIDASLTKLFECMTLAYSGKLTSPRWKQFKGLKLRLKEKIRLNNMIWRAWHMQFIMKIKTAKLCQFATPLDGDTHMKAEAVVIEGTYWKRRMANITAEYQKWRLFYRDRFRNKSNQETENMDLDLDTRWPTWPKDYSGLQSAMDEDFIMDFTDTLFTTFNPSQPFDFPNPREIAAKAGIADFIQPGLVQLQPAVDDFMDTLEPLSDLFSDFLNSKLPSLPEEGTYNSNSSQDILTSLSSQQDAYGGYRSFGRSTPNFFTQFSSQRSSNTRRNTSFKKPPAPTASKQPPPSYHTASSQFPGKSLLDTLNSSPTRENLLTQNVPLMNSDQLASQSSTLQNFMCSQNAQASTIASLLQANLSQEIQNLSQPQQTLPSHSKRERKLTFLQQPAYISKSFDAADMSLSQSTQLQMPLQTIHQGHISEDLIANSNSNAKPLFFSLNVAPGSSSAQNAYRVSNQVSSVTPADAYPASIGKQIVTQAEMPVYRRHSYTTGQHLQAQQGSGEYMGSKRSRPIAPAVPSSGSFAVPEVPQNRRARSRSVSSPQSGSPKPYLTQQQQQPLQAVSLTDLSASLQQQQVDVAKRSLVQQDGGGGTLVQSAAIANANVLQQNALLAQLLTPGCTQDMNQSIIKVSSANASSNTSPVTIIRPILSNSAHTFVFSPLTMQTASGVSNLQRTVVEASASPTFRNQDSPSPSRLISSPESPGSSCSSSPAVPTLSFDSPSTSAKSSRLKSTEEKIQYREHRRVCHINAEQKRRCNIKNGFESLHNLLPALGQTPNAKVSKAAMLQKGADHIRTLRTERQDQLKEVEMLKKQIEELNHDISAYQNQLPASGAPIPCQRNNKMKEMFAEYTRQKTMQNWKFYILSLILENQVDSYNSKVSTASYDEMFKSMMAWVDDNCSLMSLRPNVLNSLRLLSTSTSILSDPSRVPDEVIQELSKKEMRK